MTDRFERAFEAHEAFEPAANGYALTTTSFEGVVTASETEDWALEYAVTVRAPMLSTVTNDEVGPAVEEGWFDTYALRLEDAAKAVRDSVTVESAVHQSGGDAVAEFTFEWGNADRAPHVAKALVEYAEGTYMEGIVPGYDYGDPVASMLSRASQSGEGGAAGTPL